MVRNFFYLSEIKVSSRLTGERTVIGRKTIAVQQKDRNLKTKQMRRKITYTSSIRSPFRTPAFSAAPRGNTALTC